MAMGSMTTIIAKPSHTTAACHAISSAMSSNQSFLPSGPSFHPLRRIMDHHEHGFKQCNLSFMMKPADQRFVNNNISFRKKMHMVVACSGQPIPPPAAPSGPFSGFPGRKGWFIGILLSFVLPFMKNKWGPLMLLKQEVDTTLETIEETVDVAEKVLEEIEEVAHNIENKLPDGQLKDAVSAIEHVAEQADTAAHLIDDTLHRVEKLEETFEARVESEVKRRTNEEANTNKKLGKS